MVLSVLEDVIEGMFGFSVTTTALRITGNRGFAVVLSFAVVVVVWAITYALAILLEFRSACWRRVSGPAAPTLLTR